MTTLVFSKRMRANLVHNISFKPFKSLSYAFGDLLELKTFQKIFFQNLPISTKYSFLLRESNLTIARESNIL